MITKVLKDRIEPGERVLDIGTKHGRKLKNVSGDVVAVDIELAPEIEHIQYAYADGGRLPFESNSFDYIVCTQVLEHVPHTKQIIEEMSRVLRLDGALFLSFPNRLFPDQPHSPPGYFSLLPRSLAVRVAPFLLDERSATYYEENVFNLSPLRARWLLHQNFGTVEYTTFTHKSEIREIFLGKQAVDDYEANRLGKFVAQSLPVLRKAMRLPPIGGLVESFYPHSEYVCRHPKQTRQ
jgi:ubiquinone/menaquinone biosynthesis C-methylase UbiE